MYQSNHSCDICMLFPDTTVSITEETFKLMLRWTVHLSVTVCHAWCLASRWVLSDIKSDCALYMW